MRESSAAHAFIFPMSWFSSTEETPPPPEVDGAVQSRNEIAVDPETGAMSYLQPARAVTDGRPAIDGRQTDFDRRSGGGGGLASDAPRTFLSESERSGDADTRAEDLRAAASDAAQRSADTMRGWAAAARRASLTALEKTKEAAARNGLVKGAAEDDAAPAPAAKSVFRPAKSKEQTRLDNVGDRERLSMKYGLGGTKGPKGQKADDQPEAAKDGEGEKGDPPPQKRTSADNESTWDLSDIWG